MIAEVSEIPVSVQALLSPPAQSLVRDFFDPDLRRNLVAALSAVAGALDVLDRMDLDRYELIDLDLPDLSVWNDSAPAVRDGLVAVRGSLETLSRIFPASALPPSGEHDAAFDRLDQDGEYSRVGPAIDHWVGESVDVAVRSLSRMLRHDLDRFGGLLRRPDVVSSRWALLGALQEFKATSAQCLEAIAAAILRPLSDLPIRQLLPRYATEIERSLILRETLQVLAADVARFGEAAQLADLVSARVLRSALMVRLDEFGRSPSYKTLWARDKREVIVARLKLRAWDPAKGSVNELRALVEELARMLDAHALGVGRRPEVQDYDRERAELAELLG